VLDHAAAAGRDVISVGKIADIFAHSGTGRVVKAHGNAEIADRTCEAMRALADGGLLFTNFIDFDSVYGHRRDVAGYAAALETFDTRLPEMMDAMRRDDLLVVTADHGCDPTWRGTDHTREQVPIIAFSTAPAPGAIGRRTTFADVGATIARFLDLAPTRDGAPF
jgi:phosphopentomutase